MCVQYPRWFVLFRHAKPPWPPVRAPARPPADRGRMDAAEAGRRLADTGVPFDQALCSTAVRTRETWKLAVQEFPHRPKTVYEERIYEASPGELIAVLNETPDDLSNVLVIGHNPGMEALTEILAGSAEAEVRERINRRGFPTAAFAVLTFTGSWKDVEPGTATLVDYWAPTD
ncbi:SixA phosphatase family protein [Streptomyces sp. NPDC059409]|uniref:SixA phosphatase family protein n=1 Tax=Streptomyces sp. NPDC059409 TaxID=3346824 RepID=UPI0036C22C7E